MVLTGTRSPACRILVGLAGLLLSVIAGAQSPDEHAPAAADPPQSTAREEANKNFFRRFYDAYREELRGIDETPSPSRIPPPPLDAPPFPNAYWNYGGSSVIGATNTTDYPLMRALYSGPNGEAWKRSRIQVYGWINPGFTVGTSSKSNLPEGYNLFNRIELDRRDLHRAFPTRCRPITWIGAFASATCSASTTTSPLQKDGSASNCSSRTGSMVMIR